MVLFVESTHEQVDTILNCLENFCMASGAKVSIQYTKVFFSKNTRGNCRNEICGKCGFEEVLNLGKYLTTPIIHGLVTKATYRFIIDNLQNKMSGAWKVELR